MEIINARAALLSNYEVYKLLSEQGASQRQLANLSKDDETEATRDGKTSSTEPVWNSRSQTVPENLLHIQNESLAYLASEPHPTLRQNDELVESLLRQLRPFELTKAEKLSITNLAPMSNVDLYTFNMPRVRPRVPVGRGVLSQIIEEFEDRMAEQSEKILEIISSCLTAKVAAPTTSSPTAAVRHVEPEQGNTPDGEGDNVDDWVGEEELYMDEDRYGGGDDLVDEGMDED